MFIIKFNNMVKNKWVWAAFATVVAVAFGASDIFGARARSRESESRIGYLGGKPVEPAQYDAVVRLMRDDDTLTARDVWKRLAALKTARDIGISISDSVLAKVIRVDPSFADESGNFSDEIYQRLLYARGFTPVAYQEAVRAELAIRQLRVLVAGSAWAAPSVVQDRASGLSDVYTLRAATISDTNKADEVEIKPEEISAYYDTHSENYREPERRRVAWVSFSANEYDGAAEVTDDDVFEYYDANAAKYVTKGEDGEETAKPVEEVSGEIREILAKEKAAEAAYRAAADFADLFFDRPAQDPSTLDFEANAATAGRTVTTSDWFAATGAAPGPAFLSRAIAEAVFALEGGSVADLVTDAVGGEGKSEAVVACLIDRRESYVPPFETISERVEKDARADKAARLFQARVTAAHDALDRGLTDGGDFAEVAKSCGMEPGTNFVFSWIEAQSGASPVASPRSVAQAMLQLGAGDLSRDPVSVPGGALFFQVVSREPDVNAVFDRVSAGVQRTLADELGEAAWNDWLDANLEALSPEPAVPFDAAEDDDAGDDGYED